MKPDLILIPDMNTVPVDPKPWSDSAWEVFYQGEILGRLDFTKTEQGGLWSFDDKWLGLSYSDQSQEDMENFLLRRPKKDRKKLHDLGLQYQICSRKCKEVADDPLAFDQAFKERNRALRAIEDYLRIQF